MPQYAGFWLRFVAYIIDAIIVNIVTYPIGLVLGVGAATQIQTTGDAAAAAGAATSAALISGAISLAISWAYFAGFESSSWQGTPGKKALGLVVTDESGGRIGFGKATGRFFGKILSSLILLIGFIMAGFTEKKQGLHDMLAGTLVYKGQPHQVAATAEAFR